MNGIVVVDKPAGWTSHDVVAKLRGAFRVKRVGHGGTLDPMATGVLPIFSGRATRAAEFCENADKEYIAGLKLGIVTDTQDITGATLRVCDASFSADAIKAVFPGFLGAQKQIPPMYSAIKIDGKKLYDMARRGVDVPRQARDIVISDIELLGGFNDEFSLRVVCSKGTYIRTLCHDVGAALGCGGTLSSLRRTRAGSFTIDMAYQLDELLDLVSAGKIDSAIIPADKLFSEHPALTLSENDTRRCKNGASCYVENIVDGTYRFYGTDCEFLLLGTVKNGEIRSIKTFFDPGKQE